MTSGCMGQTNSVRVAGCKLSGSRAMPHEGHALGLGERTSGHMGQTYTEAFGAGLAGAGLELATDMAGRRDCATTKARQAE